MLSGWAGAAEADTTVLVAAIFHSEWVGLQGATGLVSVVGVSLVEAAERTSSGSLIRT